jgi:hypothetical protein
MVMIIIMIVAMLVTMVVALGGSDPSRRAYLAVFFIPQAGSLHSGADVHPATARLIGFLRLMEFAASPSGWCSCGTNSSVR